MNRDNRLVGFLVAATFAYVGMEYLIERKRAFAEWRNGFVAPFVRHPGRREFLRETLLKEEMTIKSTQADCKDCPDA